MSSGAPISSEVVVAGLPVHLTRAGDDAPLVVFHHSTGPLWSEMNDLLARSFTVIAVELPGFGRSARADTDRSPRDLAIRMSQLLEVLDVDRVHLLGRGFGGWVASELATMSQGRLVSMTLVGCAGIKPRSGFIHDPMMAGFVEYVRRGFSSPEAFDRVIGGDPAEELVEMWDRSREMTARLTWKQWMWNPSLPSLLRGVRTPTQLIWGGEDRVVPLDCAEQLCELIDGARLSIVPDAGHLVELEMPEVVDDLIATFCKSVP